MMFLDVLAWCASALVVFFTVVLVVGVTSSLINKGKENLDDRDS